MFSIRWMMLAGTLAMLAGCARGLNGEAGTREVRGSTEVGGGPRLLLGGPAPSVHTNVDASDPIRLYVVDRVNGDDRDCARAPSAGAAAIAPQAGRHVEVAAGRELCAMPTLAGTREVLWHARVTDQTPLVAHQ